MANKGKPDLLMVGSDRSPSRAREDYVKAIYQLGASQPVRAAALARYLHVSRVSVSKAKRQLERDGLLEIDATPSAPLQVTTNLDFDASSPPSWSPLSSVPVMPR